MKHVTALCYVAAMLTTSARVVADTAPTTPTVSQRNVLIACTVPSGAPAFIGQMADDTTCWQVAQLLTKGASSQVFFCVGAGDVQRTSVPQPGKTVRL